MGRVPGKIHKQVLKSETDLDLIRIIPYFVEKINNLCDDQYQIGVITKICFATGTYYGYLRRPDSFT